MTNEHNEEMEMKSNNTLASDDIQRILKASLDTDRKCVKS